MNRTPHTKKRHGKTSYRYVTLGETTYLPEVEVVNLPITWEEHIEILEQAKRRQTLSKRNDKRGYLLRGLIFCDTHRRKRGEPLRYQKYSNVKSYGYRCPVGGCVKPKLYGPGIEVWVKSAVHYALAMARDTIDDFLATISAQANKANTEKALLMAIYKTMLARDPDCGSCVLLLYI